MIELRLPSLGSDMDDGKLIEWTVAPGDAVRKGQVVALVDTAKAAIDIECWHDGLVHALLTKPDETIAVGTLMAVLRAPGERADLVDKQMAALQKAPPATPADVAPPAVQAVHAAIAATMPASIAAIAREGLVAGAPADAASIPTGERLRASPAARRRAQELGVDLATMAGGRGADAITLADVEAAAARAVVAPTTTTTTTTAPTTAPPTVPMAAAPTRAQQVRQVIAAAMARSKREIPHYYLADDIAFERAATWLATRNQGLPVTQRLLPAALLLKAVARALQRYPEFNGFHQDGRFVAGSAIHLGVAISLREGGLVAPALHGAAGMDVATLTRALLDLVKRTRAGRLRSSELADATITVTNLGEQSVGTVFGVIQPPQVALVGFGRIALRPWAFDDGVRAVPALTATLAADHRVSDGHRGALLLAEIGAQLQAPETLDAP